MLSTELYTDEQKRWVDQSTGLRHGANLYEILIESAKPAITLLSFCGLTSYSFVKGDFRINGKFWKSPLAWLLFCASGHLGCNWFMKSFLWHDHGPYHLTQRCGYQLYAIKMRLSKHIWFDGCHYPLVSHFHCASVSLIMSSKSLIYSLYLLAVFVSRCCRFMGCLELLMLQSNRYNQTCRLCNLG